MRSAYRLASPSSTQAVFYFASSLLSDQACERDVALAALSNLLDVHSVGSAGRGVRHFAVRGPEAAEVRRRLLEDAAPRELFASNQLSAGTALHCTALHCCQLSSARKPTPARKALFELYVGLIAPFTPRCVCTFVSVV